MNMSRFEIGLYTSGSSSRRKELTSSSQTTASQESGNDCVPHILFLPETLDGAIERRKHATPYTEVTTWYGGTGFDDGHGTNEAVTLI